MNVLVVGGAGYIGSHMVQCLVEQGNSTSVLDNLSTGHSEAVRGVDLIEGDAADSELVTKILVERQIDSVVHFAASSQVGESVRDPAQYYRNNVRGTLGLLEGMLRADVSRIVFSSTAAVFGDSNTPIPDDAPHAPTNPYGRSKSMIESILSDYDRAYGLRSVVLRYFNAAGSDPQGRIGESHDPETHLIPLVLAVPAGHRESITVFGDDYNTPDGTCIRDYIHVCDLCDAHLLALEKLRVGCPSDAFNLGNGEGFSVLDVIETAERVSGKSIPRIIGKRREGDPPRLVADASRAISELRWKPRIASLDTIIEHAWAWTVRPAF